MLLGSLYGRALMLTLSAIVAAVDNVLMAGKSTMHLVDWKHSAWFEEVSKSILARTSLKSERRNHIPDAHGVQWFKLTFNSTG